MIFSLLRACLSIFFFLKISSSSKCININETKYVHNYFVTHLAVSDFIVTLEDSEIFSTIHEIFKNVINDVQKILNQKVKDFEYNISKENKELKKLATGFTSTIKNDNKADINETKKINNDDSSNKKFKNRISQSEKVSKSAILEILHEILSCILKTIVSKFYSKISEKFGLIKNLNDEILFEAFEEIVKKSDFNIIMINTYFKTKEITTKVDMVTLIAQILSIDKFVDIFVAFGWIFLGKHIMDFGDSDLILSILRKKMFCEYKTNNPIVENTTFIFGENNIVLDFYSDVLINKINQIPLDEKPIQTNIYFYMDTFLLQSDYILKNIHILMENSSNGYIKKMQKNINVEFQEKTFKQWIENVKFFAKNLDILIQSDPNVTIFFSLDDHVFEYDRRSEWNVIKKEDHDYLKYIKIPDEYNTLKKMFLNVKREFESIFRKTLMKPCKNTIGNLDIMERKSDELKNSMNLKNNHTSKNLKKTKKEFEAEYTCDSKNILDNVPRCSGQAKNKHIVHIDEKNNNYNLPSTNVKIIEKQKVVVLDPKKNELEIWIKSMLKMLKIARKLDSDKKNSNKTVLTRKKNKSNEKQISENNMYPELLKGYVSDFSYSNFELNKVKNKDKDILKNKESFKDNKNDIKKYETNLNSNKLYETNYRKININKKPYEKDTKNINDSFKIVVNEQKDSSKIINSRNSNNFFQIKNIRKRIQNYDWKEKNLISRCSQKYRVEKKKCNFYKYNRRIKCKKNNIMYWKIKKYSFTDLVIDTNLVRNIDLENIKEDRIGKLEKQKIKNLTAKRELLCSNDFGSFYDYNEENFKDDRFCGFGSIAKSKKVSHGNLSRKMCKILDKSIVDYKSKSFKVSDSPIFDVTKESKESINIKKNHNKTNKTKNKIYTKSKNIDYVNQPPFSMNFNNMKVNKREVLHRESGQNEENAEKHVISNNLHGQNKKNMSIESTDKLNYLYENSNKCLKPSIIKEMQDQNLDNSDNESNKSQLELSKNVNEIKKSSNNRSIQYQDIKNLCDKLNELHKISDGILTESPTPSNIVTINNQDIKNLSDKLNELHKISDGILTESSNSSNIETINNQDIRNTCDKYIEFDKISDESSIELSSSLNIEDINFKDAANLDDELNKYQHKFDESTNEAVLSSNIEEIQDKDVENFCDKSNEFHKISNKILSEISITLNIEDLCTEDIENLCDELVEYHHIFDERINDLMISSNIEEIHDQNVENLCDKSNELNKKCEKSVGELSISSNIEVVHNQDVENLCDKSNEFNKKGEKRVGEISISSNIEDLHDQDVENLCDKSNELNNKCEKSVGELSISSNIEVVHNQDVENLCDKSKELNKKGEKRVGELSISLNIENLHDQDVKRSNEETNEYCKINEFAFKLPKSVISKSKRVRNTTKLKNADLNSNKNINEILISSNMEDIQDEFIKRSNTQSKISDTKKNYEEKKDQQNKCLKKLELGCKQDNCPVYKRKILYTDICNDRQTESEKTPISLSEKRKDHIKEEIRNDMLLVIPKKKLLKTVKSMNKSLYKKNLKYEFDNNIETSLENKNIDEKDLEKFVINKDCSHQKEFYPSKIKSTSLKATNCKDLLKSKPSETKNNKFRVDNMEKKEKLDMVKLSDSENLIKEKYHIQKNINNFENPDLKINLKHRKRELQEPSTSNITLSSLNIQKSKLYCKKAIDNTEDYLNGYDEFEDYTGKKYLSYEHDINKIFHQKNQKKDLENLVFSDESYIKKAKEKKRPALEVNLIEFYNKDNKGTKKVSKDNFKNFRSKIKSEKYNKMCNQNILPVIENNEQKNTQKDEISINKEKNLYKEESLENTIALNIETKKYVENIMLSKNQEKENEIQNNYQTEEIRCANCHTIKHPIYMLFICSNTSFDLIYKITGKKNQINS